MEETKKCKYCQSDIPKKAKVCPNCKKKQGKGILKWIIIAVVVLGIFGAATGGKDNDSTQNKETEKVESVTTESTPAEEEKVEYTVVTVAQMREDLSKNALKAKETYEGKYLEMKGRLNGIDSDGKYIGIVSIDDEWAIHDVQCYIKTEEQKKAIMEMNEGDIIIVKGKCKDVGELMGYSVDIDEVYVAE